MAGIGLFNFEVDGKSLFPIAVVAVASVAGIWLWRRQPAQATSVSVAQSAGGDTSLLEGYQLGLLHSVNASGNVVSNAGANNVGSSAPATASGSSVAGGTPTGSV